MFRHPNTYIIQGSELGTFDTMFRSIKINCSKVVYMYIYYVTIRSKCPRDFDDRFQRNSSIFYKQIFASLTPEQPQYISELFSAGLNFASHSHRISLPSIFYLDADDVVFYLDADSYTPNKLSSATTRLLADVSLYDCLVDVLSIEQVELSYRSALPNEGDHTSR